jgi:hypothetical protein
MAQFGPVAPDENRFANDGQAERAGAVYCSGRRQTVSGTATDGGATAMTGAAMRLFYPGVASLEHIISTVFLIPGDGL